MESFVLRRSWGLPLAGTTDFTRRRQRKRQQNVPLDLRRWAGVNVKYSTSTRDRIVLHSIDHMGYPGLRPLRLLAFLPSDLSRLFLHASTHAGFEGSLPLEN